MAHLMAFADAHPFWTLAYLVVFTVAAGVFRPIRIKVEQTNDYNHD